MDVCEQGRRPPQSNTRTYRECCSGTCCRSFPKSSCSRTIVKLCRHEKCLPCRDKTDLSQESGEPYPARGFLPISRLCRYPASNDASVYRGPGLTMPAQGGDVGVGICVRVPVGQFVVRLRGAGLRPCVFPVRTWGAGGGTTSSETRTPGPLPCAHTLSGVVDLVRDVGVAPPIVSPRYCIMVRSLLPASDSRS